MTIQKMLEYTPYELEAQAKQKLLTDMFTQLTEHHYQNCPEYKKILDALDKKPSAINSVESVPFIPVRLFKEYLLTSVPADKITRTMTSSGTTGQQVSRISLDAETSKNQQRVLSKIIASYIGAQRLPLLILDSKTVVKDRKLFGARGAGIMGFTIYGRDVTYALDENMQLDLNAVNDFLDKYRDGPILLFGYTFMIWQHFYLKLKEQGITLNFGENTTLFHVGGWKKLVELKVDNETYKTELLRQCHITRVYNYYGMAEQLGSIFVECECGHLHASIFSDIIIRNPYDFSPMPNGEKGLMEVMSVLPTSYPGHAILTEDEGIVLGEDDCACGRKGKYFKILGRVKNAELRGCSDTYASKFR
ncbi:MAG: acyl-protein synthetase [Oscillospiraceae bacterium]|nr:acyl-protein synthetase [Oscillospiraceae bacterium]